MTKEKSFKRLVRARMAKTGERYAAARAALLAATDQQAAPVLATSDAEIRRRSGRGWEAWFDLLDEWGAADLSHRDIARKVAAELHIEPLVWEAQAITVSYERARRGRVVGQRADGFAATASKTVAVEAARLFDAFVDDTRDDLTVRTLRPPTSARFDWRGGPSRVHLVVVAKGPDRSTLTVEHRRLADAAEADRMKTHWRQRVAALQAELELSRTG